MIHFHDAKALNYEAGTIRQKHMPYSACSAVQRAARGSDAVCPPSTCSESACLPGS